VIDEPIPLTPEDRAILDLECATVAGHTCKVILVDGPAPDIDRLRASIVGRLSAAPALTRKLSGDPDAPEWVTADDFDISRQVGAVEDGQPLGEDDLRVEVARLFEQRLDRDRPLWHLDLLPLEDERTALVWRIHHALADGTAAMRFANAVLWDEEPAAASASAHARAHAADDARRRGHLAKFVEREFGETFHRSPFDARIGTNRAIAFASVELAALHDAAKSLAGATVNDAILTIVAGGLRAWLEHHGGALGDVRVKVPVSLHHEGDDAGNRDSFFVLAVHLGEADPVARLTAVHAATSTRKADHDAERLDSLLQDLRRVSPRLERLCEKIESNPRRFALSVSNVPGPRTDVSVLGSPVARVYSLAEIGRRHALRVAAVSLAGRLCFGFCADPAVVEDLDEMATGLEADAAALIAAAD
jgi:hypothetical protein